MKRALIVAYYFPPLSTSGCMRPMAFCKYLPLHGWEPSVLTVSPETADPELARDQSLLNGQLSRLVIGRAPDDNMLARIGRLRGALPAAAAAPGAAAPHSTAPARSSLVRRSIGTGLRMLFAFPDNCAGWLRPGLDEGLRMVASIKPDLVLATAPPWTGLLIGASIARRTGVPLVADFRDPWTAQERRYADLPGGTTRANRLEKRTIRDARRVIANTVEAAAWLRAKYPQDADRIVAIPNGYDPDLVAASTPRGGERRGNAPLELCHFGTVYRARSPKQLLLALSDLSTMHDGGRPPLRVRFIGHWQVTDPETLELTERLERAGIMMREPALPHAACLQAMRNADALLILQPDLPLQIPGKLYEYIAVGRPLVVVGGEGATASLVTRERLGVCCKDDRATIRDLFRSLASGEQVLNEPDPAARHRFEYRAIAERLAATLDEAVARPRS
jgi:glycosyltransferase involved in cell wall biosynthesis